MFRDSGELDIESPRDSPLLSFFWRNTALDKSHYGQVLETLAKSDVIFNVDRGLGRKHIVVLFQLSKKPNEERLRMSWPTLLQSNERELTIRFKAISGFPAAFAERFAADVHRLGTSLHSWKTGVVVKVSAGYIVLAERIGDALYFTVRFDAQSAEAAWKALCAAQHMIQFQYANFYPGLFYEKVMICAKCLRERRQALGTTTFDETQTVCIFRPCGHCFSLFLFRTVKKNDCRNINFNSFGPASRSLGPALSGRDAIWYANSR